MAQTTLSGREKMIRDIKFSLGATLVDFEFEQEEYDYCIELAIDRYRQRSDNSMEESYVFLDVQKEITTYTLPPEVQEVRSVYRRVNGSASGATVDPFSLAMTQNIYMLQNPGGLGGGGSGQLATYDFAMQYQELVGRMFGRDLTFQWNAATKKISFDRKFEAQEHVVLHVYNAKPEEMLFQDPYARPWLRSAAVANAKIIMGQARSKFGSYAGPQGGISMNGSELKAEGQAELQALDEELKNYIEQHGGYGFIIG